MAFLTRSSIFSSQDGSRHRWILGSERHRNARKQLERRVPSDVTVVPSATGGFGYIVFENAVASMPAEGIVKANKYRRFSALNPAGCGGNSLAKTVEVRPTAVREQAV
jgi:hypothetical protein